MSADNVTKVYAAVIAACSTPEEGIEAVTGVLAHLLSLTSVPVDAVVDELDEILAMLPMGEPLSVRRAQYRRSHMMLAKKNRSAA